MYHHVVSREKISLLAPFAVSTDLFSQQLSCLEQEGFNTITFADFFDFDEQKKRQEVKKPLIITFDDCSAQLFEYAVPELRRRGMTATFFAVAGKLGGFNDWDAAHEAPKVPLMSGNDLKILVNNGFEIGSHGLNHTNLRQCRPEQIRHELMTSRNILEDTIGKSVHYLAYPYGEYPVGYADYCRDAGYRGAVSIFSRARAATADPFCMRRILIHEGDTGMRFRFKMSRLYQWLRVYVDHRVLKGKPDV